MRAGRQDRKLMLLRFMPCPIRYPRQQPSKEQIRLLKYFVHGFLARATKSLASRGQNQNHHGAKNR